MGMEIPVRLSAGLAEYTGRSRLHVALEEGATLADLMDRLCAEHPALTDRLAATVAVVSGRHLERTEPLQAGQEVALLIPISGGNI
jgi:molybdopterin converting factor small subunit